MDISSGLSHILDFALTTFIYIVIIAIYSTVLLLTAFVVGVFTFRGLFGREHDVNKAGFWIIFLVGIFVWVYETRSQFPDGWTLELQLHVIVLLRTMLESVIMFGIITGLFCLVGFIGSKFSEEVHIDNEGQSLS